MRADQRQAVLLRRLARRPRPSPHAGASTLPNGRRSHAAAAIHGDASNTPPKRATNASRSRRSAASMSIDSSSTAQAIDSAALSEPPSPSSRAARSRPWTTTRREFADGHIVCEGDRIAAVGAGPAPRVPDGASADRRPRQARHARARQLPPPPLPARDARLRAAGDAVRVARRALPGLGAHRRRGRRRRRARRAGRARALGLHDLDRPPLHLPAPRRRPAGGRDRGRARDRPALPPLPRRDGPRPQRGRPAARRRRRGPRRDPRRQRRRDRPLPRSRAGRDGADRARPHVAVLGQRRADGARPRSSPAPAACACTRTSPRPTTRRRSASSASACGRSSTSTASAGSATTSGSRTASTSTAARRSGWARPAPASRTARPPTAGSARASRPSRRCSPPARRSGSASTAPPRTSAASWSTSCARRSCSRASPAGPTALTARQALELATRHGARCLGPRGRARPPQRRRAGRRRAVGPRRARLRRHRRPGRGARVRPDAPRRTRCSSAASSSSADGELRTADPRRRSPPDLRARERPHAGGRMKCSRGVRAPPSRSSRPANHYPSRLPPFGDAPVVKLVTPRFAPARIGEYLLALPAGGGTTRPVAPGFETFLYALEGDGDADRGGRRVPLARAASPTCRRTRRFTLAAGAAAGAAADGQAPL